MINRRSGRKVLILMLGVVFQLISSANAQSKTGWYTEGKHLQGVLRSL